MAILYPHFPVNQAYVCPALVEEVDILLSKIERSKEAMAIVEALAFSVYTPEKYLPSDRKVRTVRGLIRQAMQSGRVAPEAGTGESARFELLDKIALAAHRGKIQQIYLFDCM